MKKKYIILIICVTIVLLFILIYYSFYEKSYTNNDFNILDIESNNDQDNDGIDDYTDIFMGANMYVQKKPRYKSKYYDTGYPNDNYGVCTDVVAFAFLNAGYNLQELVNEDIVNNKEVYNIDNIDKNIDFRRVKNLKIFFDRNSTKLTTDINDYEEFQKGDIVIFPKHIAIISDKRNRKGIPYIIHNNGNHRYIEDALSRYEIIGHYRWKRPNPEYLD